MTYETIYDEVQTEFIPAEEPLAKSSLEKTTLNNAIKNWILVLQNKKIKELSFYTPDLYQNIYFDYSSSIFSINIFYNIENDTGLSEEYHRKQEQIKAIDDIAGLLKDFTPEQMKIFKEAVKRRPLF